MLNHVLINVLIYPIWICRLETDDNFCLILFLTYSAVQTPVARVHCFCCRLCWLEFQPCFFPSTKTPFSINPFSWSPCFTAEHEDVRNWPSSHSRIYRSNYWMLWYVLFCDAEHFNLLGWFTLEILHWRLFMQLSICGLSSWIWLILTVGPEDANM